MAGCDIQDSPAPGCDADGKAASPGVSRGGLGAAGCSGDEPPWKVVAARSVGPHASGQCLAAWAHYSRTDSPQAEFAMDACLQHQQPAAGLELQSSDCLEVLSASKLYSKRPGVWFLSLTQLW